jgi:hypothetical protein
MRAIGHEPPVRAINTPSGYLPTTDPPTLIEFMRCLRPNSRERLSILRHPARDSER